MHACLHACMHACMSVASMQYGVEILCHSLVPPLSSVGSQTLQDCHSLALFGLPAFAGIVLSVFVSHNPAPMASSAIAGC